MTNAYVGSNQVVKIMMGDKLVWSKRSVLSLDFVNQVYNRDGQTITFSEAVNFTRASKAWLVTQPTITEYDANIPRISSKGLLIEQEATNYARWSFLPENGEFSRSANVYFPTTVGMWKKSSSSTSNIYVNSLETLTGDVVGSVCAAADHGNVSFTRMVFGNVIVYTERLLNKNVFYYARNSGVSTNNTGVLWDSTENVATSSAPMYFQIEKGLMPSSPIKTTTAPVTRLADVLELKAPALSVTGDWDSTLNISLVGDKLVHTGYGYIRSLVVS